jgi:hypothetical protein
VQTFFFDLLKPLLVLGFCLGVVLHKIPQKPMRGVSLFIIFFSMNTSRKCVNTCPVSGLGRKAIDSIMGQPVSTTFSGGDFTLFV